MARLLFEADTFDATTRDRFVWWMKDTTKDLSANEKTSLVITMALGVLGISGQDETTVLNAIPTLTAMVNHANDNMPTINALIALYNKLVPDINNGAGLVKKLEPLIATETADLPIVMPAIVILMNAVNKKV